MASFAHGVGDTLKGGACTSIIGIYKWLLFGKMDFIDL